MHNLKVNERLFVSADLTKGEDTDVLIVGKQNNGKIDIINAFQGQEAADNVEVRVENVFAGKGDNYVKD